MSIATELAAARKDLAEIKASNTIGQKSRTPTPRQVLGAPNVRRGENAMTSRGFSYLKMFGAMNAAKESGSAGFGDAWANAKVEREVVETFHKMYRAPGRNFDISGKLSAGSIMGPLGTDFLPFESGDDSSFGHRLKSLVHAGTEDADPDEMAYIARKMYAADHQKASTLSWLDHTLGGSLVGPPEFGELIDLLRNEAVLTKAGARTVPLPPSGRIVFPRQTAASTATYVGENASITQSDVRTGSLVLSAKTCGTIIKMPNALIRYASPAAEALARNDMAKTLGLTVDKYGLEGAGGDVVPLGILNTPGIATVTPTTVASDGNTLDVADLMSYPSAVEENNGTFESWILRPQQYWGLLKKRAGSGYASDDGKGLFLYDPFRSLSDKVGSKGIIGYPAHTSNQVSKTRVKGNSSALTYVMGGMFSEVMIAMFGALEFAVTNQGDTAFQNDQTWIRAIMINDIGIRHPGVIAVADTLVMFS